MKCEIRNQLRELAFPESTSLKAPKDKAISKGATKKVVVKGSSRVTRSTGRLPSRWEHVDKQFPDTQESQNKPTSSKKRPSAKSTATVSETPSTRIIPHIDDMPKFMHKYIDDIIDVEGADIVDIVVLLWIIVVMRKILNWSNATCLGSLTCTRNCI
jgi:hypothetical protein